MKLEVRELAKTYAGRQGEVVALTPTSFTVAGGEFVSLLGPSGCGKSTTLGIIAGLEEASAGAVFLDGARVSGPGPERGMVFQSYTLFPWLTVEENTRFALGLAANAPRARRADDVHRADALLEVMGLADFRRAYPRELSGGMKQRVAIARALVNRPKVLLMDEPFGALDAQTREEMQELMLLLQRHERTTVLFVTHDIEEAMYLSEPRAGVLAPAGAHPARRGRAVRPGRGADLGPQIGARIRAAQARAFPAASPLTSFDPRPECPRHETRRTRIMLRKSMSAAALVAIVAASSGRAGAGALKPYRVGFNAWIGSIAFFVAQDKGFFKDEGLDVQTKSFSSPGDGLAPLVAGSLDAHLSTADSVLTVLDKAPGQLKVVYLTDTSAGADAILAKKEIADIKGMKGKKVAATLGQCNQLLLEKALEKAGLTDKDIQLVNMNPDDAGAAFSAGKVDVAVTWEPWITKISGEKKGHVIFSSKETPNLILDVLAISSRTAKSKAPETKAFLRALNRGYDFVQKNPDEAAAIAGKALEQKPDEVKAMLPKVNLYSGKQNLQVLAGPAAKASAQVAQFFKDKKVNETLVDVNTLYDASYLK